MVRMASLRSWSSDWKEYKELAMQRVGLEMRKVFQGDRRYVQRP